MKKRESEENYLKPIIDRASGFLKNDAGIGTVDEKYDFDSPQTIELESKTILIGTNGGELNTLFAVSYSPKLLDYLMRTLNYGEILPEEEEELLEATACELVNTIIGNAISDFPDQGKGISLTPPIVLNELKSISKRDDSHIIVANINTEYGNFMINLIWPQFMFEGEL
jgi:chemotaxis protein CheX